MAVLSTPLIARVLRSTFRRVYREPTLTASFTLTASGQYYKILAKMAADQAILRIIISRSPHRSPIFQSLLKKRDKLRQKMKMSNDPSHRSSLSKVNAEIRRTKVLLKRGRWDEICKFIDGRTPNTKI
ncbi:hypothetical protein CEXT_14331 [Caerostris extrusa]|uniref:Uncharacterized protein n=1 Tax=Caerostris extrusa TaxID=172846 RepID=A0AAV4P9N2_CAEEX|nr:hypothetical protein CEXT_14331 [Caerostris extrusa]